MLRAVAEWLLAFGRIDRRKPDFVLRAIGVQECNCIAVSDSDDVAGELGIRLLKQEFRFFVLSPPRTAVRTYCFAMHIELHRQLHRHARHWVDWMMRNASGGMCMNIPAAGAEFFLHGCEDVIGVYGE